MPDQNKIVKTLSAEQLQELLDRAWKTPNLTLQKITDLAAEYGVSVSLMGATSFRDTTYARHLQAISSAADLHKQMAALKADGVGVGAAAEMIINQKLIDQLIEFETTKSVQEDGGVAALDTLSKITKRLTDSERGSRALQTRIEELERREAERNEKKRELAEQLGALKKRKGGITPETIAEFESKVLGL